MSTVQSNTADEEWNVVKGKKPVAKQSSPKEKFDLGNRLKNNAVELIISLGKNNRFSNLSNLERDSNASVEEVAATIALVLDSSDAADVDDGLPPTGMTQQNSLSPIPHLEKNFFPKAVIR